MQRLYRIFWASNDDCDDTRELGFVVARDDEEAFELGIPRHLEAGSYGRHGRPWLEDAFFSVEPMEDADRLADILEEVLGGPAALHGYGNLSPLTLGATAEAMLKSV